MGFKHCCVNFNTNRYTVILYNQNQNEITIKDKQNRLYALQMFKDKLTGDRVTREMILKTVELRE